MTNGEGATDATAVFTFHIHLNSGEPQPKSEIGAAYLAAMPTGFIEVGVPPSIYDSSVVLTSITKED
jgi:hypothetical protein